MQLAKWDLIAKTWYAQALFANLHVCFYGSQTMGLNLLEPPTVHEYLAAFHAGNYVL